MSPFSVVPREGMHRGRRYERLRLEEIRRNPEHPRTEQSLIASETAELAQTLDRQELIYPILVKETADGFLLVSGLRRILAAEQLGWETIDALVVDGDPLEVALIENWQRVDLHPVDLAHAVAKLMTRNGWDHEDAALALG